MKEGVGTLTTWKNGPTPQDNVQPWLHIGVHSSFGHHVYFETAPVGLITRKSKRVRPLWFYYATSKLWISSNYQHLQK